MKKLFVGLLLTFSVVFLTSCSKEEKFTIIGKWGMISGTITNSDGSTNYFEARGNGVYYECLEFKQDGTLIRTYPSDGSVAVGVYTYNDATKSLSYKYNGDTYFMPGVVSVISSSEMNLTTDLGSVGLITQYFEKIR